MSRGPRGAVTGLVPHSRSLRWKIVLLVALACASMALTVGVLVHDSVLRRSMHEGAGRAHVALATALENAAAAGEEGPRVSPEELPEALLRQVEHGGEATLYENEPPAPVFWAARQEGGKVYAVEVDMTADLLTRQALDRHMWKYSLLTLGLVVPATALATELPARRRGAGGGRGPRARAGRGRGEGRAAAPPTRPAGTGAAVEPKAEPPVGRLREERLFVRVG
ncbi:two-component sensor histidine kinase, partial [Streptomyces sp. NPDC059556]